MKWQPISTAPKDGKIVLLYRPLAYKTGDPTITTGETYKHFGRGLPETVPDGYDGRNYTSRACYATHWMPLPEAPAF